MSLTRAWDPNLALSASALPSPPNIINMPPFAAAFIAAAAAGTAIYGLFFGGSKDDDKRGSSSSAPPPHTSRSTERTLARLTDEVAYSPSYSPSPPDSHSRDQANTRTPVTSASHHDLYHSSRSPTHPGDSQKASSTSTQAQSSNLRPSSSTHASEAEARFRSRLRALQALTNARAADASLATQHDNRQAYRSDTTSRFDEESRETLRASDRTHGSQPPQTRIGQTRDSTTTMAGYGASVHRTGPASHHVWGSSQTPSASTYEQASNDQLSTSSRVTGATAKTQTRHLTSDHDGWYRSTVASPYTRGSSDTFATSAHTHVPQPLQVTSTRVGQSTVSTDTTPRRTHGVHGAGLASHYTGESGQTTTSTYAEASYSESPTHLGFRITRTTTQINPSVPDNHDYGYRSSDASSNAREPRETFSTSTRAHVPRSPQATSTRVSQSTVSTTATADYPHGNRRPHHTAPYSAESIRTGPASPTWASYQRTPSPDDDFGYPDFLPSHSRTPSSSSGSDYLGASSSTRVALRSPSPQPDALYGTEFEATENTQDMKDARELRRRARRCAVEMRDARDLAKSARRSGDHTAAQRSRQDAIALESEMKSLDKRAAKIIFGQKNKVSGDLL